MRRSLFAYPWVVIIATSLLLIPSCIYESDVSIQPDPGPGSPPGVPLCDTVDISYSNDIVPIMNQSCTSCHGSSSARGGIRLHTYDNVKPFVDNGLLLCTVTHSGGCSPMPRNRSKLPDCQLLKISTWINEGAPNN